MSYILLIIIANGNGNAISKIEVDNLERCQQLEAQLAAKKDGPTLYTTCLEVR